MSKPKRVTRTSRVPARSTVSRGFEGFHYCDSFRVEMATAESVDSIVTEIFRTPRWADALMAVRNAAARIVGLDSGGRKSDTHVADRYAVGSRAVYFTVIDRADDEIVTEERDEHLDFRVSVMVTRRTPNASIVELTTLVRYNKLLGRMYFTAVRPFHRLIVISLLRSCSRRIPLEPSAP